MDANSLEKHMKKYLDYCENQKGISHKTVKAYRIDLNQFTTFLQMGHRLLDKECILADSIQPYTANSPLKPKA